MENLRKQFKEEEPEKVVEIRTQSDAIYFTEYYVDWLEEYVMILKQQLKESSIL